MDKNKLIRDHIAAIKVMQLATSVNDQPQVCTVTFYADDDLNVYWLSATDTRHSQDIAANGRAAVAMAIHTEFPLQGVQMQGKAEVVAFDDYTQVLQAYADRHDRAKIVEAAVSGKAPLKLYKFTPEHFGLFDLKNFPDAPKQEWQV